MQLYYLVYTYTRVVYINICTLIYIWFYTFIFVVAEKYMQIYRFIMHLIYTFT